MCSVFCLGIYILFISVNAKYLTGKIEVVSVGEGWGKQLETIPQMMLP